MAYHITGLGSYGRYVRNHADLNGYVPEAGDQPEQFTWDALVDLDYLAETWADTIAAAVAATREASEAIAAWQQGEHR